MNILITGGAGFIGRHLVRRFTAEACRVMVLDLRTCPAEDFPPADLLQLDVAGPAAERAVRLFNPHLVIHAAAQTRVAHSLTDPTGDARTNILGTIRMLEAARSGGARGFIFFSSAAIYGEPLDLPMTEEHPTRPLSPYGHSKLAATGYVDYYREKGLLPALTLIPANVYGPGQPTGKDGAVVPAFVAGAAAGQPLGVDGDGTQTRDFVYVDDLVEAVWLAWSRLQAAPPRVGEEVAAAGEPVPAVERSAFGFAFHGRLNIGSGRETSITDLAALVERVAGKTLGRTYRPEPAGSIKRSALNSCLARGVLDWTPAVSLAEGVERTYRAFAVG